MSIDPTVFAPPSLCQNAFPMSFRTRERANALLGLLSHMTTPVQSEDEFTQFSAVHKKKYAPKDVVSKKSNYLRNKKLIKEHNINQHIHGYNLAVNHFADLHKQEFFDLMMPTIGQPRPTRPSSLPKVKTIEKPTEEMMKALPLSLDWRTKNAVTRVKDQGICGSCWTFGTAGSIEGQWAVAYGQLFELSEQQIVDCSWETWYEGNSGCDGGFAAPAMDWVLENRGIANEHEYPYLMVDSFCDASNVNPTVKLTGYVNVSAGAESALQYSVATFGPVSVAIDAAHAEFEFYSSGVYYNPKCKNDANDLDHEVLVVGYGTENGKDYWIVKNSWSTHWGDKGYIKMARNMGNNCGIATQPTFPLVK